MGKTFSTGLLTNGLWQDASNNIGIGGSPSGSYKFEVTGTARVSGASTFSSSIGVGLTPSAWGGGYVASQVGGAAVWGTTNKDGYFSTNLYYDGTNVRRIYLGEASYIGQNNGQFSFYTTGSGAANSIATFTQPMTITSSGNVGIGTSSPSYKLSVVGDAFAGIGVNDGTNTAVLQWHSSDGFRLNVATSKPMLFFTNDTERMRITSTGKIGFNTSTPFNAYTFKTGGGNNLDIFDTGSSFGIGMQAVNYANTGYKSWDFYASRFSFMNGKIMANTTDTGINAYMYASANSSQPFPLGSKGIDAVQGLIGFFDNANNVIGSIFRQNSSTQYNTSSDYRLKEDFKNVDGLSKVLSIKVYDFKWKGYDFRTDGVLAHELQEILPYAVQGEKDDVDENGKPKMQGVDYSKLVPVIVKAVQELSAKVSALENKS